METSQRIRRWAPLALLILFVAVAYASGLTRYLSFAPIREHGVWLREQVAAHPMLSVAIFFVGYTLLTTSAIPGAIFVTLTGGFLFGTWVAGAVVTTAATLGAVGVYYIVRSSLGAWLREYAERDRGAMKTLREGLARNAFWYLLSLRLVPAVPFILINIASGLTSIPVRPYALATFLGIVPCTFIYTAIGSKLGEMFDAGREPSLQSLLEPQFLWLMLGVAFLSGVLPVVFRLMGRRPTQAA